MLLKPPRPQTKWFWKTNSQLDPFLAFKTSNTKNNPIVVDEILACPSSNFDFFSRFGNWATSTSTCSTNFYDRFFWLALKTERNGFIHHSHVLLSFLMLVSFFLAHKMIHMPKIRKPRGIFAVRSSDVRFTLRTGGEAGCILMTSAWIQNHEKYSKFQPGDLQEVRT